MKKLIKISLGITIIIVFCTNYFIINIFNNSENNLSLRNISAMQASAGEMWCDQTDPTECKITFHDITGYSTGVLHFVP